LPTIATRTQSILEVMKAAGISCGDFTPRNLGNLQ